MGWEQIDSYRNRTGKKLAEVAADLGISVSMLMMIKSGKNHVSPKGQYRLEQAEIKAGLRNPEPKDKEAKQSYRTLHEYKGKVVQIAQIRALLSEISKRIDEIENEE